MFAYCLNNPILFCDPVGTWSHTQGIINPSTMVYLNGKSISDKEWKEKELRMQAMYFFNTNEEAVLNAEYFAFYKGVLVVRTNGDRSGAFGIIFLTRETNSRNNPEDMVRHEYGHIQQLKQLAVIKYLFCILLPSWQEWGTADYYNKWWEISADIYGGVLSRPHEYADIAAGFAYLEASKLYGPFAWMLIE